MGRVSEKPPLPDLRPRGACGVACGFHIEGVGGGDISTAQSGESLSVSGGFQGSENGAPAATRTRDPRLRRPMLYPPELQARNRN